MTVSTRYLCSSFLKFSSKDLPASLGTAWENTGFSLYIEMSNKLVLYGLKLKTEEGEQSWGKIIHLQKTLSTLHAFFFWGYNKLKRDVLSLNKQSGMFKGYWEDAPTCGSCCWIFYLTWFGVIEKRSQEKKSDIKFLLKCERGSNTFFSFPGITTINSQGFFKSRSSLGRLRARVFSHFCWDVL